MRKKIFFCFFLLFILFYILGKPWFFPSKAEYNLVLITIDTLRADHLGCYGYQEKTSPGIDALAQEGVLFERAYSQSPLTFPSHASILSGTNPTKHGILDNLFFQMPSSENIPTLSSVLSRYKYRTGAVVSAAPLAREKGLSQGFLEYDDNFSSKKQNYVAQRNAQDSVNLACDQLKRLASSSEVPFFQWLHLYDPHAEYTPPSPFKEKFSHPYDGEIAYTDYHLTKFLKTISDLGLEEKTIIVLVGDHGEGLGEHGEKSHGYFLYNTTLQVPLIIKAPGLIKGGQRVVFPVQTIDIMPTVLSLIDVLNWGGKDSEAVVDGVNLASFLISGKKERSVANNPPPERPFYSETFYPYHTFGWRTLRSIMVGDYKYIDTKKGELYYFPQDKKEEKNLLRPEYSTPLYIKKAQEMHESLLAIAENRGLPTPLSVDPNFERISQGLGYQGGKTNDDDFSKSLSGPCPSEKKKEIAQIIRAQTLIWYRQTKPALKILEEILLLDPENILALKLSGKAYKQQKKLDKAAEKLKLWYSLRDHDVSRNSYIDVLLQTENHQKHLIAQELMEKVLKEGNADAFIYSRMSYLKILEEKFEEAIQLAEKATLLDPSSLSAWFYLAKASVKINDKNKACLAYYEHARVLSKQKKIPEAKESLKKALGMSQDQPILRYEIEKLLLHFP